MSTRIQAPTTAKLISHDGRITDVRNDIWIQSSNAIFRYDIPAGFAANKIRIAPARTPGGDEIIVIPFRVLDVDSDVQSVYVYSSIAYDILLSQTGINEAILTGGRVDGLGYENGRTYLVWGFYDPGLGGQGFSGMGITRKPYSSFSTVASGAKGATATYTVVNAYQFTIGARVVVKNTFGTAPLYEYNWGTVSTIASGTSITVLMDNNANYGTNITSATGGVVEQWDKFKPWVVAGGSQTLYKNSYFLLGELTTVGLNIMRPYRVTDEERELLRLLVVDTTTSITASVTNTVRFLPLWADMANLQLVMGANITNTALSASVNGAVIGYVESNNSVFSGSGNLFNTGFVFLEKYAQFKTTKANSVSGQIYLLSYRCKGGMKI